MKKHQGGNKDYKLYCALLQLTLSGGQSLGSSSFTSSLLLRLSAKLSSTPNNVVTSGIYRVCVKGSGLESWLEAAFLSDDQHELAMSGNEGRWSLDNFKKEFKDRVKKTDPDNDGGEITVRLPSETMPLVEAKKILRLSIEFALERPEFGIHFVIPSNEDKENTWNGCHLFTYNWGNSSRQWFPCMDSLSEVCTWKIEVTVDTALEVICPGDLTEKVYTPDEKGVTHHFTLSTPTSASNIGLAIGSFDITTDPEMADVTFFSLRGLNGLVKNSVSFLSDAFEFLEESLNMQYPHSTLKIVFVDEAYSEYQSFQSMAIVNTSLLYPESVIEQTFITRKVLVECLVEQFFCMFVSPQTWADRWLIRGIVLYLTGLFLKKNFGNNEYRHWLMTEMRALCDYELDGPTLPPLYPLPLSGGGKQDQFLLVIQQHPHLVDNKQRNMMETKSHLVVRMIELRIGQDLLLQTFNKVLSLASSAASKRSDCSQWHSMMLSTVGFLKTISTVSGKDIEVFVDKWICHTGVAKFNSSFSFNRKRNIIELEINQFPSKGSQKYVGPLTVCIQELDGSFTHTVQVEDSPSNHELPCHSKSRRNKKKKIPLITGEEVDMDLTATFDTDSPVLWVRIDHDLTWARRVTLEQPDYMWQYQLRYERDIISQIEAVRSLERYPCAGTRSALIDIINQTEAFYKVRIEAVSCLAKVATMELSAWDGESEIIDIFNKFFGSNACPSIPKYNEFSNFVNYLIQKTIPLAVSKIRSADGNCSKKVINFILNLLKYCDNRFNKFCDGYYISSLIHALSNTIGPSTNDISSLPRKSLPLQNEVKVVLAQLNRHLNMEKILPTYKYTITCSCLKAIRCLQVKGHIPSESALFRNYTQYGLYEDIRTAALEIMVDFVNVNTSEDDMFWLLQFVECDPVPRMRHFVVSCFIEKPPFQKQDVSSPLNNMKLVERIWNIMNSVVDYRLRCDLVELYKLLWGNTTPSCIPSHKASAILGKEELNTKKRKSSFEVSTDNEIDSHPGTPLSMCSESSASKIKLKIKIDNQDELVPMNSGVGSSDPLALMNEDTAAPVKKVKKKKKKKHKHKEKKEGVNQIDFANSLIPGVSRNQLDDRLSSFSSPSHSFPAPMDMNNRDFLDDSFKKEFKGITDESESP